MMAFDSMLHRHQVRIQVVGHELEPWHWKTGSGENVLVVGGMVIEASSDEDELKAGDEVVAYVRRQPGESPQTPESTIVADMDNVLQKPSSMQLEMAVELTRAYSEAAALLHSTLNVCAPDTIDSPSEVKNTDIHAHLLQAEDRRELLIVGGQKPLAVALAQLLRLANICAVKDPKKVSYRAFVTTNIPNQYDLVQRCVHLVMLGADMTIDDAAEDLGDYINRRFDYVFDITGAARERPVIMEKLKPEAIIANCSDTAELCKRDSVDLSRTLVEKLLQEAADAFQEAVTPTCGLDDE